jgi:STE24 endopeptidase
MTADKAEKLFWIIFILWILLRTVLMGAQLTGNTDPSYNTRVREYFSEEQIENGKEYALYGFWVRFFYGFFFVAALLILVKCGFYSKLHTILSQKLGEGLFRTDLAFIVLFLVILQLFSLPYSYYMGHIRETSMGFSNMNSAEWFVRYIKSAATGIFIQTSGILLLLWVVRFFENSWIWVVPIVMGCFSFALTLLFPIIVTPLFYEQKPLEAGEFKNRLLAIAQKAGMKTEEIYVINESKYSKHTNAYFTGFGRFRRIVLYDNLINNHTPEEAALIFAHEAGHWRHNHVAKGLSLGVVGIFLICILVKLTFPYIASIQWLGANKLSSSNCIPAFFLLATIFQLFTAPIESQISQYMEVQADTAALELTGLKEVYISAQKKLSSNNKSDLTPSKLRVFWLYSHPPALERIELANKLIP